jgi:hypothetical protein
LKASDYPLGTTPGKLPRELAELYLIESFSQREAGMNFEIFLSNILP